MKVGRQSNENIVNCEEIIIPAQEKQTPAVVVVDSPAMCVNDQKNTFFSRVRINKMNALEIRAAITMSVNILPFWICTFQVTCNAIALYWCIRLGHDCSIIFMINPYLRNMFLFHVIYNPMMYMLTSREFRQALSHFLKKRSVDFFCCQRSHITRHRAQSLRGRLE